MNFNLEIEFTDGTTKEVAGIAADIVAFESKFDLSITALEKNIKLTHLLFLSWHVEKRTGSTKLEFEKWVETVNSVSAAEPKK